MLSLSISVVRKAVGQSSSWRTVRAPSRAAPSAEPRRRHARHARPCGPQEPSDDTFATIPVMARSAAVDQLCARRPPSTGSKSIQPSPKELPRGRRRRQKTRRRLDRVGETGGDAPRPLDHADPDADVRRVGADLGLVHAVERLGAGNRSGEARSSIMMSHKRCTADVDHRRADAAQAMAAGPPASSARSAAPQRSCAEK